MQLAGTGAWGLPADKGEAIAAPRRAVELGVDLIDTADSYGPEVVNELMCEALFSCGERSRSPARPDLPRTGPDGWVRLGRAEHLRRQCKLSLRRLKQDPIDMFQLHRIEPKVPAADQLGLVKQLRGECKVAEVGLSEVVVAGIDAGRRVVPAASVQYFFDLSYRVGEDELKHCERGRIGFFPWLPLATIS